MSPRVLIFSDLHLGGGANHRENALADHEAALEQILDLARDNRVDLILNGGDTYDRPNASLPAIHVWRRFTAKLEQAAIPMISVLGNSHDLAASDAETAVEIEQSALIRVSRHPEVITEFAGVAVCTLPSVPMGRLVAAQNGGDRTAIYQQAADGLIRVARGMLDTDPLAPTVLVGHWFLDALVPAGITLNEPVLPAEELRRMGFDLVAFGHVHDARLIGDGSLANALGIPVLSIGTPICLRFGEEHVPHGVWLVDLDQEGVTNLTHVPLPDRLFVTVDVDLTKDMGFVDSVDETDMIASSVATEFGFDGNGLDGAIVRVRYRASEAQHRRVDQNAVRRLIVDAGGRCYQIDPDIIREARTRAVGVDESLDPLAAVAAWCDANEIPDDQAALLTVLTAELVAEESA